ncbi:uncharacterized protein LOC128534455 [Clarias gariepinus]|uniref:uncharacterized protein LOC128534455 n=1 Tax=Clarias gariepinus TaxID=13013 RepID=UPI00234E1284|nr:uncharacterized protein LOC128534455 [Clarias gariepinus]
MVVSCWVNGCTNRAGGPIKYGFYSIPIVRHHEGEQTQRLSDERRRLWLARINRKEDPSKYSRVCSVHFVNGKPSDLYARANPDWAPSLNLSRILPPRRSARQKQQSKVTVKRYARAEERRRTKEKHEVARVLLDLQNIPPPEDDINPLSDEPTGLFYLMGKNEPKQPCKNTDPDAEYQKLLTENMMLKAQLDSYKIKQENV